MTCAIIDELRIEEDRERLRAFFRRSGVSRATVAQAINERFGGDPNGKDLKDSRIWNWIRPDSATEPPTWFLQSLTVLYPDWQSERNINESGRQNNSASTDSTQEATQIPVTVPVVSFASDAPMSKLLQEAMTSNWEGRKIKPPRFINPLWPLTYVETDDYAGVIDSGDAIQLRPNVHALRGRLYHVTLRDTGEAHIAACVAINNQTQFILRDGTAVLRADILLDAAVTALLPQYVEGKNHGIVDDDGLIVGNRIGQIPWPPKNS